jgi:hypothetical protein
MDGVFSLCELRYTYVCVWRSYQMIVLFFLFSANLGGDRRWLKSFLLSSTTGAA